MDLIIFCGSRAMWNARSVFLHHLCLIFLAGTDTDFQIPSSMRSRGDTSSRPHEGGWPDEEERVVYPPIEEETVAPWDEGSSSGWGAGPSSSTWEDPRASVDAPEDVYDPWTYQYYPGVGRSSGPQ